MLTKSNQPRLWWFKSQPANFCVPTAKGVAGRKPIQASRARLSQAVALMSPGWAGRMILRTLRPWAASNSLMNSFSTTDCLWPTLKTRNGVLLLPNPGPGEQRLQLVALLNAQLMKFKAAVAGQHCQARA